MDSSFKPCATARHCMLKLGVNGHPEKTAPTPTSGILQKGLCPQDEGYLKLGLLCYLPLSQLQT